MFVREVKKPNGSVSIRIVESVRRGDKVVQKTIRTLGQHKDKKEIELIKRTAEQLMVEIQNSRQPVLSIFSPEEIYLPKKRTKKPALEAAESPEAVTVNGQDLCEQSRHNDGIHDIFGGLYEQLELDKIISSTKQNRVWNETLKACVLSRLARPESKKKSARFLDEQFNLQVKLDHVYRMMDHVASTEQRIKDCVSRQSMSLFKRKIEVLLFDVTTLYFESVKSDELRDFGFSKDCKFNQTQVVLALMTTSDGTPMGYELFPGNLSEGKTLIQVIASVKRSFDLERVILCADRAMFSQTNLEQLEALNVRYVVAAKLRSLSQSKKREILESKTFKLQEVSGEAQWLNEFSVANHRRLIVSYSALRATKDQADRERILNKLRKKSKEGELNVKDIISNQGCKKFITCEKSQARINADKIARDAQWDGLHGIISNDETARPAELLARYRQLWKIEEAFRFNKHDLKLRPIYHWKPRRIRAHIAICYLAFALLSYARVILKRQGVNISFDILREELLKAQSSIIEDKKTGTKIRIPSQCTDLQRQIYQAFGQVRRQASSILPV